MKHQITDSVFYVGVNDYEIDLFEGLYPVQEGMAYNSYVIADRCIAVLDTVDGRKTQEWLSNLEAVLEQRQPDYLIVHHMEPDHSASLRTFLEKYPDVTVVANRVAFGMMERYFPDFQIEKREVVKEGDELSLGSHVLRFVSAPLVHWPEVMMSYELSEKLLFSADAFGRFGALDDRENSLQDSPEGWAAEARRYYFGIVGRFGMQVQNVLKKLSGLEISRICPLHGPVISECPGEYLKFYDIWSSYRAQKKGVCICYASVYGHTKEAAELLARQLREAGVPEVVCHDLTRCDHSSALADAFCYDRLVLAGVTYNADIFPCMKSFIESLLEHDYQDRTIGLVESGSWAPMANRAVRKQFEQAKGISFTKNQVTIRAALNGASKEQIDMLTKELSSL